MTFFSFLCAVLLVANIACVYYWLLLPSKRLKDIPSSVRLTMFSTGIGYLLFSILYSFFIFSFGGIHNLCRFLL